ncbi:MAG: hypothetical protein HUJ26_05500 [Planctomycetaceae bacterium]|nr:hypothetical protein [Planctomycetaceae bacterium]
MDSNQRFTLLGACMAAGILAGCAAPYPYQPYQPQPYPGGMYGQPGYMAPGSTLPQGGVELNAPTPINPGTNGGGDAPMWNPDDTGNSSGGNSSGGNSGDNSVPFYDEPGSGDLGAPPSTQKPDMFNEEKSAYGSDDTPFGQNETTTDNDSKNIAFEEQDDRKTAAQPALLQLGAESAPAMTVGEDETVEAPAPISLANAEFEEPIARSEEPTGLSLPYDPNEIPNPFGHDGEGFRFLRGLVSYDDKLEAWSIIYDDKPSRDDEYGGVLTLADHPGLTVLNDNDVVYIEGKISDTLTDAFGKPRYVVEHLNKLKPKSAQ